MEGTTLRASGRRARLSTSLLGTLIILGAILVPATAVASDAQEIPRVGDGLSAETAAASCWEIKQQTPNAGSGVYWLVTPTLGAPEQFYCDQVTDGGGWVLIGRGRENWNQSNEGRLTAADVAQTPIGPAAFSPAQLSVETISGLLNGGPVDELDDGVRLVRAVDTAGYEWQEARFHYASNRDDWSWQFAGVQGVGSFSFDSSNGSGGTTGSWGSDNKLRRVETNADKTRGWARGFGFGSEARGNPETTSYVYAASTSTGYPKPFTQVYLRPKLISTEIFTDLPDAGLPAVVGTDAAQSYPLPTSWGVTGLGAAGTGELNTEVAAFAESNGVMYVGGNFRYVQRDSRGTDRVEQSYIAAFDALTGEWKSDFRPVLNNQVKAITALPDGRIAIGGAFNTANGIDAPAFAVLDPVTGAVDPQVTTKIINYAGGTPPVIRTMDLQGDYLYIGGRFTHVTGSGVTTEVYQRNIGRLNAATLAPLADWTPTLDGTVVSVDASDRGDRVFAAGYFGTSNWKEETLRAGAFTADDATVIPWTVRFSNTSNGRTGYQQAVREVGDRVWLGGSEHMLFSYDRDSMDEMSTNISQDGGDFQAINTYNDDLVAGCHCAENVYQGARTWPTPQNFYRVEHIEQAGIWRASDGEYVPEFSPQVSLRSGSGAWAIQQASDGTLWLGGDYTHARRPDSSNQWTGGFVRFPAADTTPPATPASLTVDSAEASDTVSWKAAIDAVTYEVLRQDRVIAVTEGTTVELPTFGSGTRYFVRAVDAAGNRSATSPVTESVAPAQPRDVLLSGSTWSYYFKSTAPAAGWEQPDFDDSSWQSGPAPLGWGHKDLGTTLTTEGTKPIASYYRNTFEVQDATKVESLTLTTRADDGIVVYVNGTEVGRTNMPAGAVGFNTYATAAPSASYAVANPVTYTVSGALLNSGTNTITAEVHSNYRSTPSASFEASGKLNPGAQPAPAPKSKAEPEPTPTPEPTPESGHSDLGTTRADDGIVVYVNGTEVGRSMPEGTIQFGTYATALPTPSASFEMGGPLTLKAVE